jgi:hypothetical protein
MALLRAAGLCRLALRTQWSPVRLLSAAGGEPPGGEQDDALGALRHERALRPPSNRPPAARQVLASSQAGLAAWSASHELRERNKAIATCATVDEVLDLVAARWALVDCVTVSTALSVIARRRDKREPALWLKGDERFRQLMRCALSLMERQQMDAQGYSNTLYSCGQLGIAPPTRWLRVYWESSAAVFRDFNPQNLSNTLFACWQLDTTPPADWLDGFWLASAATLGEWNAQDFCQTLYACGQLGVTPPDFWLVRFWEASAAKLGNFSSQNFSDTLYACGKLGVVPPADWQLFFWQTSVGRLRAYSPQGLSNALYACGQLAITPPDYWLERFWLASAANLRSSKLQELSNTVYACGLLDTSPPAGWLQLFSSSCEQALPDANQQNLAKTALALTMLQLWELPMWRGLWERLCGSVSQDVAAWSAEDRLHAMQMYQAYQAAAVEQPSLLLAPTPELFAAVRKSWIDRGRDGENNTRAGRLHSAVSACLRSMGLAHTNERWCDRAERSIDIAIEGGAVPIAVEVDGPHHFLQDGRSNGSTMLRNRMLTAHGWRVVVVEYRAWETQQTPEQQEAYLRGLLEAQK